MSELRETVRERYAAAAVSVTESQKASCCDDNCGCGEGASFGSELYENLQRDELPDAAVLASLGCGNPTAVADLDEGDVVLDLGSGGGIDVLLSAKRVGSAGKVYGLDMTEEMLALAIDNAKKANATNVEFLKGYIEDVPLPGSTVDVIISNCVINLSIDKPKVFAEMYRVLKPGGRIGVSDVISNDELTPEQRAERGSYVGCIAGALSFSEYKTELAKAGFENIEVTSTHEVTDGMHSAIVKATKPASQASQERELVPAESKALPMAGCC